MPRLGLRVVSFAVPVVPGMPVAMLAEQALEPTVQFLVSAGQAGPQPPDLLCPCTPSQHLVGGNTGIRASVVGEGDGGVVVFGGERCGARVGALCPRWRLVAEQFAGATHCAVPETSLQIWLLLQESCWVFLIVPSERRQCFTRFVCSVLHW